MPEYIDTREAAEMVRTSPETMRYYRWKGIGPKSFKIGRKVLYARADVVAWIESARQAS